jgi:hypothetical protein
LILMICIQMFGSLHMVLYSFDNSLAKINKNVLFKVKVQQDGCRLLKEVKEKRFTHLNFLFNN